MPDPNNNNNWDKIVEIIATVMAQGAHGPYKNSKEVMVATETVSGHVVEVTYKIIDGVKTISNAWVKP